MKNDTSIARPTPAPFPIDALPEIIREAAIDTLQASNAPDAIVASNVLATVALACQNSIDVQRLPGLIGPCSLNITILANSGERKSYVDSLLTKPFRDFDDEQLERNKSKTTRHKAALASWEIQCKAINSAIAKAATKGDPIEELTNKLEVLYSSEPEEPHSRQILFNDSTVADLKYNLRHPFSSVGIFSDEPKMLIDSGLLRNLAFFNKMWDSGALHVGRRTSESFRIANARLTQSLGFQPNVFFEHFFNKKSEARGIGFHARGLIAYPMSTIGSRLIGHRPSSFPRLARLHDRIAELLRIEQSAIDNGTHARKLLKFSPQAQQKWIQGYNNTEVLLGPGGSLANVTDFVSKLGDNVARIAALFHHFEGDPTDEISLDTLNRAIAVGNWYLNEFERIFAPTVYSLPQDQADANTLEQWLLEQYLTKRQTLFDKSYMEQRATNHIRPEHRLTPAIEILIQRQVLIDITVPPPRGRKTKVQYQFNVQHFQQLASTRPIAFPDHLTFNTLTFTGQ